MGKKKSVVLLTIITIVMVALCVLTAFPSFTVPGTGGIKIWNPSVMQFDLGMDLGGKHAANTSVGGGFYAYYYPDGVIPETEYETNFQILDEAAKAAQNDSSLTDEEKQDRIEERDEYQGAYIQHGGLYLSTDVEDGVLEEINGEYVVTEEFKSAFAKATKEIGARYAAKQYEDYLVTCVDDYALRIELPASQASENITADSSAQQAFNVFALTGKMTFQKGGSVVDEMKDEDVTIKDIVKSIKVKTKYDYAYIEIQLTKAGVAMVNAFKAGNSDGSATLDLAIGDDVLINLNSSHFSGDVIKYTAAEDVDKHYVETMVIVLNSALENGGYDITFTCSEISKFAPVYNNNSLYFVFVALLVVMVGLIVFSIIKMGRYGIVNAYATVSYFIITALCFAFISKGVFVVSLGSVLVFLLGLVLTNVFQMHIYNAIKTEFDLGKTVDSSVKGGYKKTLWNIIDVYAVLVLASLALLIGTVGLQTVACQALICVIAAAFCNLVWARLINHALLSASKDKYKYFRFVREDDDDE